jgi:PKD repeat protein
MKKIYSLCFGLLCLSTLSAQETLSGIINFYAAVQNLDVCANSITVDDPTGFEEGMEVILYQAQGASIDLDNSSSFGTVTNLGQAGRYEKNQILSIAGNSITLAFQMTQAYDPAGKVQLISFPSYAQATVNDTLQGSPWNGNKGGIIALQVTDTLRLEAPIIADGIGFRGGVSDITVANNCSFVSSANNYSYGTDNWRGAAKGEGIAIITPGAENGRGPQANGGGGGNDHNAGGGGGSNLNRAGQGGTNEEPSFFGCGGNFPGFGGREINSDSTRLFLGGGGGAGHENNDVGTDGGNGGGIIILSVNTVITNGFGIQANGLSPELGRGDGAGGGGGGGTILLLSSTPASLEVEARGGDGGSLDHGNVDRCHGPGGGGSGGHILTNAGAFDAAVQTAGGLAGMGFNSSACADGNNGSEPGFAGVITTIQGLITADRDFAEAAIINQANSLSLCEGENGLMTIATQGVQLSFQWQLDRGNGFENITNNGDFEGATTDSLQLLAVESIQDGWNFRVQITDECGADLTSDNAQLAVSSIPIASFTTEQDANTLSFTNNSQNATAYLWDFGNGVTSTEVCPSYTFNQAGEYTVSLTAFSSCDTVQTSTQISIAGAPTATFTSNPAEGCAPLDVSFTNTSVGEVSSVTWLFPGGSPAFSNENNPTINYNEPGNYDVTLIVSNAAGVDSLRLANHIEVGQAPVADFDFTIDGLNVSLSDASSEADEIEWYIAALDTSSTASTLTITFPEAGTYDIQLTATNACGPVTVVETLNFGQAPNANFSFIPSGACEEAFVLFSDASTGTVETYNWEFPGGTPATSTEANPTIFYENAGLYTVSLSVEGPLGASEIVREGAIEVLLRPNPNFNFTIDGLSVSFQNTSSDADRFTWSFGDGNSSNETNPTHVYAEPGLYDVSLNAQNRYCGLAVSQAVFLKPNTTQNSAFASALTVYPNPFNEALSFLYESTNESPTIRYECYDDLGRRLERGSFDKRLTLVRPQWPRGTYWIKFEAKGKLAWQKVVKAK